MVAPPDPLGGARRSGMAHPGRGRGLVVVLIGALLLAACGGGGGKVTTKRRSTTTTSTTTTTQPTVTTTAVPQTSGCVTTQLGASFGMVSAGAGNRYVRLILANTGASPCVASGYVGLQLVGGGSAIPTNVVRSTMTPVTPITVAPGAQASSLLHWGAIPGPNEPQNGSCEPTPQQVQISVPNQASPLVAAWSFGPVCEQGQIEVGALQAGVPAQ